MKILLATAKPKDGFTPYGPPLGLCYLSSYLKAHGYGDIRGIDLNVEDPAEFLAALVGVKVVGLYCSTKALRQTFELARQAKAVGCVVVLGGPHPSLCPDETLADPSVDFLVRGEGELTFLDLIRALDSGNAAYEKIDGLSFRDPATQRVVHNSDRKVIANLDELPSPDLDLFVIERYPTVDVNIAASRGCPYKCTNCQPALNSLSGRFRRRSVKSVLEELDRLKKSVHWSGFVHFVDNDLTISRKWIEEFCREILARGIKIRWACEGRANTLDRDLMVLMKEAGCRMVGMGVESGSDRVLKEIINKGITVQQSRDVVALANEVGIEIHCWFILGIPGETREEMQQTIDVATSLDAASIGFSIGTPWPGTIFHQICKKNGYMLSEDWDAYNEKRTCRLQTEHFGPEDVEAARQYLFKKFTEKGWRVDQSTFIVQNPYYNRSLGGKCFFLAQSILYALLGHQRAVRMYGRFKRLTAGLLER